MMAGHARYELTSASPPDSSFSGNYQNGQRAALDRSSSFRDGTESRMFGFGKATPRGSAISSDMLTLSQCLMLDPIFIGDKKNVHSAELKRALGFSVGSGSEDSSFGTAYLKNSPTIAVEELKRLRANVADTCVKASGRAKRLDDHLNKLNKFFEAMPSKKQQRHELMANERSGGSTLKIGSQMHRNSSELGNPKSDDRPKNIVLNKRVRSSVTETRVDPRNNVVPRPSIVTKERDLVKYHYTDSDMAEEKIRSLPASGEGWDKKMKRKRSVGAVFSRSVDSEGEMKRNMHHKLMAETCLQTTDSTHGFRSGAISGSKKFDSTSPVGSSSRPAFKNEQEKSSLSKDFPFGPNKEREFGKGIVKLTNREDNLTTCTSSLVKGKGSRAPRSGFTTATNTTSVPRTSGTLESWEQPQGINKTPSVGGPTNRKRVMPAESSSPPITQWGGQRPHKISRTRRTNLMPMSNQDEVLTQLEAYSPSSFGPRSNIVGTNASFLSKSASNGTQNFKVKAENVPSPARLSESEESGVGENRIKDRGLGCGDLEENGGNACQNIMLSAVPSEKNKSIVKKEVGDSVRRQECSGRVTLFSRGSTSPLREKVDNLLPTKPLRNARSASEKNGSKSGRRLKKPAEGRSVPRPGQSANRCSPDCSGESEDDHEEILEAANLAFNSSLNACLSEFWKTVESWFAPISTEEKTFLSLQLKLAEESCGCSSQDGGPNNNLRMSLADYGNEEICVSNAFSGGRNSGMKKAIKLKDSLDRMNFSQHKRSSSLLQYSGVVKEHGMSVPFYQRVLSALIVEVDIEESEETGFGRPMSSVNDTHLIGIENKKINGFMYGVETHKNGNPHFVFPCNGSSDLDRSLSARGSSLYNGELKRDGEYILSEVEVSVRLGDYIPQSFPLNNCSISPIEYSYEQMSIDEKIVLELQSLGLLESIPGLDDKEDETINQEIFQLERGLLEQTWKKKTSLDKLCTAVQDFENDERCDPEQVAMDKLVELAYKKLLATRGSFASKHGIAKVPKQAALVFIRRALGKCRKFEASGVSCFTEPAFREIIYATPPRFNETELLTHANVRTVNDGISLDPFTTSDHRSDHVFAKNGPILNRGKKKEVLLDDVVGISGGAKGKRSERDNSSRNPVAKAGRSSKGDRKTKSKPKQKTAQLCTSGSGFVNKFTDTSGSGDSANDGAHRKKDIRFKSSGNVPPKDTKESIDGTKLSLNIGNMVDLDIDSEVGALQEDFNSWFSFDVDGVQDHGVQEHDFVGLPTPMDELTDIF